MAETGMESPTFSAVTSCSVMTLSSVAGSFEPGAGIASAARQRAEGPASAQSRADSTAPRIKVGTKPGWASELGFIRQSVQPGLFPVKFGRDSALLQLKSLREALLS